MHHDTPSPYGDLTRRWQLLDPDGVDRHAARILAGGTCLSPHRDHVGDPALDAGRCYVTLVTAAVAGDPIAVGWFATTHLPQLLRQGLWLLGTRPQDWAVICHDALTTVLLETDVEDTGRWLRRRIAQRLRRAVGEGLTVEARRRQLEEPVAPDTLVTIGGWVAAPGEDVIPDGLTLALRRAMGELEPTTRSGLLAIASDRHPSEVSAEYQIEYAALRQRIRRARPKLQARLACWVRTVDA